VADSTENKAVAPASPSVASGLRGFLGEVKVEMLKCTWPTRTELREQTVVVVVSVLLLAVLVWVSDVALMAVMSAIF
jgi:preprotein translocase subunit SecE